MYRGIEREKKEFSRRRTRPIPLGEVAVFIVPVNSIEYITLRKLVRGGLNSSRSVKQ